MANIYDMVDTWNDGATTFTAIKMNVTDTASDTASRLLDLQLNGASNFIVGKDTIEKRNGANPQTLNLYNTYTDASNYERLAFVWDANRFEIRPEAGTTGVVRAVRVWGQTQAGGSPGYIDLSGKSGFSVVEIRSRFIQLTSNSDTVLSTNSSDLNLGLGNRNINVDAGASGALVVSNLPTSDPTNAGQIWNDAGTLKISAG